MPLREVEPRIDVAEDPLAEMSAGNSVLTPRLYWKGQGSTLFPSAQKRNFGRVWGWGSEETLVTPERLEDMGDSIQVTLQRDTLVPALIRQIVI